MGAIPTHHLDHVGGDDGAGGNGIADRDPDVIAAWSRWQMPACPPLSMLRCDVAPVVLHCVIEDGRNTHTLLACGARDVIHGPCGGKADLWCGDVGRDEIARAGELGIACYRSYCGLTK